MPASKTANCGIRRMLAIKRWWRINAYEETGRGTEAGYDRVFMRKQLRG